MGIERFPPALDRLPRPVFARNEALPADSLARRHVHPWAQLSWASSGVLVVRTPEASHLAPPQRAVWLPPGMPHEVTNSRQAQMRSLYIAPDATALPPTRCLVLEMTPLVRELISAVTALPTRYEESGPDGRLVAVLLDRLAMLPEAGFSLPWPVEPRLAAICQALTEAPGDKRGIADWARRHGMTGRTLARRFQAATGMTFGHWRRRARLLAALTVLEGGGGVTGAALECGYDSPSAFIAAFREVFGATPGEFTRGG